MKFRQKLNQILSAHNLNLASIFQIINATQENVFNLKNSQTALSYEQLKAIREYLSDSGVSDLDIEYLSTLYVCEKTGIPYAVFEKHQLENKNLSFDEMSLIINFKKLSTEGKHEVLEYITDKVNALEENNRKRR